MGIMNLFRAVIIVQLFFGFGISLFAHTIPAENLERVTMFEDVGGVIDQDTIRDDIEDNLGNQLNMPIIELGALVFFSGNILIDMLLNSIFAIPEMITLLFNGFLLLFNVDQVIITDLLQFVGIITTVLYFIALIQLLVNVRSGTRAVT